MQITHIASVVENDLPLKYADIPIPEAKDGQISISISTCGVCHTELDEIEGRTPPPVLPVVPGHQVIGRVAALGSGVSRYQIGDRVGVAWIYSACGECAYCRAGNENLCAQFKATGRDANGGYAQYMVVDQGFAYPIPSVFNDSEAAPLLCAGAVGYRSLRLANLKNGDTIGLTGFGASAHLVLQVARARYPDSQIFVFTRSPSEQEFALDLGAAWAGDFSKPAPVQLTSIIETTPVWKPVLFALENLTPGGRLVINAIRKEEADKDIFLSLDYPRHLWLEKEIKSVANITRADVTEFLSVAAGIPIHPEYQEYALEDANTALIELKQRKIRGAKVIKLQ